MYFKTSLIRLSFSCIVEVADNDPLNPIYRGQTDKAKSPLKSSLKKIHISNVIPNSSCISMYLNNNRVCKYVCMSFGGREICGRGVGGKRSYKGLKRMSPQRDTSA